MNDSRVLWLLIAAGRRIEERLEGALEPSGLSLAKLNALKYLVEAREPLALGQLAEKIACVKSNVTQLVDRLENDGLVRRLADPNDRRSVLAVVTDLGRQRYQAGSEALISAESELLQDVPDAIRAEVSELVSSLGGGVHQAS
ncbi:MAG: MarR family winged helix-turn-helix transcriptional regulator [Pseudomonas sp.]